VVGGRSVTAGRDLGSLVQEAAGRLAKRHMGVVVAALAGESVEVRGAGRLDGQRETTPDTGTLFEIGSVTKVFTALALARLAVAGTVDLDEPVRALLPDGARVPTRGGVEITLRHLATHTSGLPRLPKGMLRSALLHPRTPDPYAGCALAGAGGLRSTATDLLAFARAQIDGGTGELAAAIELSHDVKHRRNDRSWMHLGWMGVRLHPRRGAHTILWHNGATAGFCASISVVPVERVAVVVLSNTARSVDAAALGLLNAILAGRR
jgi:CubicO group peptidase (beta-lactamase class C family)